MMEICKLHFYSWEFEHSNKSCVTYHSLTPPLYFPFLPVCLVLGFAQAPFLSQDMFLGCPPSPFPQFGILFVLQDALSIFGATIPACAASVRFTMSCMPNLWFLSAQEDRGITSIYRNSLWKKQQTPCLLCLQEGGVQGVCTFECPWSFSSALQRPSCSSSDLPVPCISQPLGDTRGVLKNLKFG